MTTYNLHCDKLQLTTCCIVTTYKSQSVKLQLTIHIVTTYNLHYDNLQLSECQIITHTVTNYNSHCDKL